MRKLLLFGFIISFTFSNAQMGNTELTDVPWTIGFGVNVVDNSGAQNPFNTKNWNFSRPWIIEGGYQFRPNWAINGAVSINKLTTDNLHNNQPIFKDSNLFALDVTVQYMYDHWFTNTPRIDPFEAYVVSGLGFTNVFGDDVFMFDFGLGFNLWLVQDVGIRLQSMGKFAFNDNSKYLNNYIQHSVQLIYRFE